jgi:hypothetical protein
MLRSTIVNSYAELNSHTSCSGDCQALAERTMDEIAVACSLKGFAAQAEVTESTPAMEASAGRLLLAAWLILMKRGSCGGGGQQMLRLVARELGEQAFRAAMKASGAEASTLGGEGSLCCSDHHLRQGSLRNGR